MGRIRYMMLQGALVIAIATGGILPYALQTFLADQAHAVTSSSELVPDFQSRIWHVDNVQGPIAADAEGNVYVISGSDVVMYDGTTASTSSTTNPAFTKQWTGFTNPSSIVVDQSGNVYVAQLGGSVVEFANTLASGDVSGGVMTWTGLGANLSSISVDSSQNIVVVNDNVSVRMFNQADYPTGGAVSAKEWSLSNVYKAAIGEDGNIYAAGYSNKQVDIWPATDAGGTPTPTKTWTNVAVDFTYSLMAGGDNYIYISQMANGTIGSWYRVPMSAPAGDISSVRQDIYTTSSDPEGMAIDSATGNLYGSNWLNSTVQKFVIPQNLADLTYNSKAIHVALPNTANITAHSVSAPTQNDGGNDYPSGLVDLTYDTAVGASTNITMYFQTGLSPSDVVARKYSATTETYSDLAGATITQTTWNSQPALKLEYAVTDGGTGDEDGVANGVVVDPVGLATADDPAEVTTGTASNVTQTSATINGTVKLRGDISISDVQNDHNVTNYGLYVFTTYGTSSPLDGGTDAWNTAQSSEFVQDDSDPSLYTFINHLTGLTCGTTYYYQNSWEYYTAEDNPWSWSTNPEQSFTTASCATTTSSSELLQTPGAPNTGAPRSQSVYGIIAIIGGSVFLAALVVAARRLRRS